MIVNKEDFFNGLEFSGLVRNKNRCSYDVSIQTSLTKGVLKTVNFTFRNGIEGMLGDGERLMFARFKNRIIFKLDDNGVKFTNGGGENSRYAKFCVNPNNEYITGFVGDYELKYDELYEYYYVEKETK